MVVFPKAKESTGYSVLSSREYLAKGAKLDEDAAAIRFNADTTEPFSVIWEPQSVRGDPEAVGRVHVIGAEWIANIMRDMIEKSATSRVRRRVDSVIEGATHINGHQVPSTPRSALTDTGLVRSVTIPPGRLRVLSHLDGELLKPGSTLTHELMIAATVPEAIEEARGIDCEIAVFPKGWVEMESDSSGSPEDMIVLPVPAEWGRPPEGRTGAGSRYVYESVVSLSRVRIASKPPASRRPPSGQRSAEIRVRLVRGDVELCRLHHPFGIQPPRQRSRSQVTPSAFAEELEDVLLDLARLDDVDVAKATGVPVGTVRAWLRDTREPSGKESERVHELSAIVDRLAEVMNSDFIGLWLRKPHRGLGDEKPLDVLALGRLQACQPCGSGTRVPGRVVAGHRLVRNRVMAGHR